MTKLVEPTHRPAPDGDSALPQELLDWCEAKDYRASWQPYNENYLNGLFGKGFEPLPVEWIEKEEPELYEKLFVGAPGVRRLLVDKATGYIRNFDTVLMVQKKDLWEATEARFRDRISRMEGPGADAAKREMADALADLLNEPSVSDVRTINSSQDPMAFLERALREREEGA